MCKSVGTFHPNISLINLLGLKWFVSLCGRSLFIDQVLWFEKSCCNPRQPCSHLSNWFNFYYKINRDLHSWGGYKKISKHTPAWDCLKCHYEMAVKRKCGRPRELSDKIAQLLGRKSLSEIWNQHLDKPGLFRKLLTDKVKWTLSPKGIV